ncbi:DUF4358 domain-containing protein [Oceanirhabdus sp. W0125-5]|uniref:DUF4358 domain-containing protein n=1 Tax=Oceanirhabdus sp. W0125-5 TaxID=2999116 RepID=UPI0022F2DCC4|nr:DUF4358 domain-containing protein [Oceanirhabdus sp. W0125-5]WBW98216.1 DUF4358 domain-containing protein [Oceanirhabdus sp. W0125-5]
MKKILSILMIAFVMISFASCGQKETVKDISLKEMADKIKELPSSQRLVLTDLSTPSDDNKFLLESMELNTEDLEEGYAIYSLINVKSDMIVVFKAKDESSVENLKKVLDKTAENQEGIWSQYLPDQYEKVQNRIVKEKGKYLIYIVSEEPQEVENIFDEMLQ